MELMLPPERLGPYAPGRYTRAHHSEKSDTEYLRFLCDRAKVDGTPAAFPK